MWHVKLPPKEPTAQPWADEYINKARPRTETQPKSPTAQPWAHHVLDRRSAAAQRGILLRVIIFAPVRGKTHEPTAVPWVGSLRPSEVFHHRMKPIYDDFADSVYIASPVQHRNSLQKKRHNPFAMQSAKSHPTGF